MTCVLTLYAVTCTCVVLQPCTCVSKQWRRTQVISLLCDSRQELSTPLPARREATKNLSAQTPPPPLAPPPPELKTIKHDLHSIESRSADLLCTMLTVEVCLFPSTFQTFVKTPIPGPISTFDITTNRCCLPIITFFTLKIRLLFCCPDATCCSQHLPRVRLVSHVAHYRTVSTYSLTSHG